MATQVMDSSQCELIFCAFVELLVIMHEVLLVILLMRKVEEKSGLERSLCTFKCFSASIIIKTESIVAASFINVIIFIFSFSEQLIVDINRFPAFERVSTCILPCGSSNRQAKDCSRLECSHFFHSLKAQLLRSSLASWCSPAASAFFIAGPCYTAHLMRWRSSPLPLRSMSLDDTSNLNNIKFKFAIKLISFICSSVSRLAFRQWEFLSFLFVGFYGEVKDWLWSFFAEIVRIRMRFLLRMSFYWSFRKFRVFWFRFFVLGYVRIRTRVGCMNNRIFTEAERLI